jgi:hypothetical protein
MLTAYVYVGIAQYAIYVPAGDMRPPPRVRDMPDFA